MHHHSTTEIVEEFTEPSYDKLLDHEYDGIREYDNPLPGWWKNLFYLSILFAFGYWGYYHFGGSALSVQQIHALEVAQANAEMKQRRGKDFEKNLANDFQKIVGNPQSIAKGKEAYTKNGCLACHRPDGGGLIGPNLTDRFWIFGPQPVQIYKAISNGGRPNKGMEAWGKKIAPDDIKALVAYVISLRGTNPPNPKKPEPDETPFP
ncbi:c-type cytochrome [Myxococcota bacterium]|nr:c-type cytochrome [Myxococcota bacterium]